MKIFSADVKVAATAYIVAETEEEALAIYNREFGEMTGDELPTGGLVNGDSFERMVEEAQDVGAFGSLSPAVTFYGPWEREPVQLSIEFDSAEEAA